MRESRKLEVIQIEDKLVKQKQKGIIKNRFGILTERISDLETVLSGPLIVEGNVVDVGYQPARIVTDFEVSRSFKWWSIHDHEEEEEHHQTVEKKHGTRR